MLLHGDELGRTQQGNNNGYAQDNELTWIHWDQADEPLIEFTALVSRLRHEHPAFRRWGFFDGRPVKRAEGDPLPDIVWFTPDGSAMDEEDWQTAYARSLGVFLNGQGIRERGPRGEKIVDRHFLLFFNAHVEPVEFTLPSEEYCAAWEIVLDTADGPDPSPHEPGSTLSVESRSVVVLREWQQVPDAPDYSPKASVAAALGKSTS